MNSKAKQSTTKPCAYFMGYTVHDKSNVPQSSMQDLPPWRSHQMETFSTLLALCAGNSPVTGECGQSRGALMFSLICVWTKGWVNNRDADDLRCHRGDDRAHYDVTVMCSETQQNKAHPNPVHISWDILYMTGPLFHNLVCQICHCTLCPDCIHRNQWCKLHEDKSVSECA